MEKMFLLCAILVFDFCEATMPLALSESYIGVWRSPKAGEQFH